MLIFQVPARIGVLTGPFLAITGPLEPAYRDDLCGPQRRSLRAPAMKEWVSMLEPELSMEKKMIDDERARLFRQRSRGGAA